MQPRTKGELLALALLLVLAGVLRGAGLGTLPPALHHDEAATAADALELPGAPALTFRHERGGWVEGTYVWAAAPAVALAARTGSPSLEAAARLPAALGSVALVLAVYLVGRVLGGPALGLAAAACLAVSPWGWHFGRLALRATLVPPLATLGVALVLVARQRGQRWALAGGLALALAGATYPPARPVAPLLALAFAWAAGLPARGAALAAAPAAVVLALLLPWTLAGAGAERLGEVAVWGDGAGPLTCLARAARGYVLHFSPRFLFSGASSRGFAPEGVGLLPLWHAPLLALGCYELARRARGGEASAAPGARQARALLAWLLLAPAAAALTRDVPNALRAALALPAFALVAGVGLARIVTLARARRPGALALTALALVATAELGRDAHAYFVRYPREQATFYHPERRALALVAGRLAAEGRTVLVEAEFLEASLRLYAPNAARRRHGDRWVVGPGAPTARLEVGEAGGVRVLPLE